MGVGSLRGGGGGGGDLKSQGGERSPYCISGDGAGPLLRQGRSEIASVSAAARYSGGTSPPFFPGILLSTKPPETEGNGQFLKRTMVEQNRESSLRIFSFGWLSS